jgi:hypothetical protein
VNVTSDQIDILATLAGTVAALAAIERLSAPASRRGGNRTHPIRLLTEIYDRAGAVLARCEAEAARQREEARGLR